MRRTISTLTILAALTAISLSATSLAAAATEIGDNCVGDRAEAPRATVVALSTTSGALPISAPQDGVITKWKVSVVPYPGGISEKLKVLRPAGPPNTFTVVGESGFEPVVSGSNTYPTRLSVKAGDRIGAFAPAPLAGIYCEMTSAPSDIMGFVETDPPLGGSATFTPAAKARPALAAVIEPDADGDGYGDETQDLCPQSAAVQVACPLGILDAIAQIGKRSVRVFVASSLDSSVTVTGTVALGKGRKATIKAGPKTVLDAKIAQFTLRFPAKLKERLQELEPKKKLTLKITARTTNVAGQVSTDKVRAKLKGQG